MASDKLIWRYAILIFLIFINTFNIFYIFIFNVTSLKIVLLVLPALKDIYLLTLFLMVFSLMVANRKTIIRADSVSLIFGIISFGIVVFVYGILSPAPASYIIYNARQLLILFLTFFVFYNLDIDETDLTLILKWICIICYAIVCFGFLEYFLPNAFWGDIIGMEKYAASRFLGGTETARNYSSDLYFLIGRPVRRMMSFFAEPVTLGIYITCLFSLLMFVTNGIPKRKILLVLLFVSGLLVFSKIFLVSLCVTFFYKWIIRKPQFYPLAVASVSLYFIADYLYEFFGKIHGSFAHLFGYYTGINLLTDYPLGFGLGMAGNRGFLDLRANMGEFGGESGLGNITAQIGLFGLLFPFLLLLMMFQAKIKFRSSQNAVYIGIFVMIFNYFINFYLSAASLGITGNIMVFIIAGLYLNPRIRNLTT